jgi:hypothetical protein
MKSIVLLLLLSNFVIVPLAGQTKKESKEAKVKKEAEEFDKMKALIDGKVFQFEAGWTTSYQGNRINLFSRPNLLRINKDSVDVNLAYFGTLQSGSSAINNEGGVVYKGPMDHYESKVNEKKRSITVKFDTKGSSDSYQFIMTIFRSGNTVVSVSSPVRSTSKYDGTTKKMDPKK